MNAPSTAREALIVEALGDVAALLDRVEALTFSMEAARLALDNAGSELSNRLKDFEAEVSAVTQQVKLKAVEHIARRVGEATNIAIETQTCAMNSAARLAFSAQVDSNLARLISSLQQVLQRVDRPWDLWLTHAATAATSTGVTWWLVRSLAL
jgi:hypothetical protein